MLIFNQAVLIFVPLLFKYKACIFKYKNKKIVTLKNSTSKGSDKKSIKASV